jgi:hypothetical protein
MMPSKQHSLFASGPASVALLVVQTRGDFLGVTLVIEFQRTLQNLALRGGPMV